MLDIETIKKSPNAFAWAQETLHFRGANCICPFCQKRNGSLFQGRDKTYLFKCFSPTCSANRAQNLVQLYATLYHTNTPTALAALAGYVPTAPADLPDQEKRTPLPSMIPLEDCPAVKTYLQTRRINWETIKPLHNVFGAQRTDYPEIRLAFEGQGKERQVTYNCRSLRNDTNFKWLRFGGAGLYFALPPASREIPRIWVVEGEIDALSLYVCGQAAVALSSASNTQLLLDRLQENRKTPPLVLALDNDQAGATATGRLIEGLTALHIGFQVFSFSHFAGADQHKDFNEILIHKGQNYLTKICNWYNRPQPF